MLVMREAKRPCRSPVTRPWLQIVALHSGTSMPRTALHSRLRYLLSSAAAPVAKPRAARARSRVVGRDRMEIQCPDEKPRRGAGAKETAQARDRGPASRHQYTTTLPVGRGSVQSL